MPVIPKIDPSRTVGKGNYFHRACWSCGHPFSGGKRDTNCAICQEEIIHKEAKRLYEKEMNHMVSIYYTAMYDFKQTFGIRRCRYESILNTYYEIAADHPMAEAIVFRIEIDE